MHGCRCLTDASLLIDYTDYIRHMYDSYMEIVLTQCSIILVFVYTKDTLCAGKGLGYSE